MMRTAHVGLLSLSGHVFRGDEIVRLAYLDEGGKANKAHEPHTVVAGVVIRPDQQWRKLQEHLRKLQEKHFPGCEGDFTHFHAMDIWHGSRFFDRERWCRELRWRVFEDLVQIPAKFNLPVIAGYLNRSVHSDRLLKMNPDILQRTISNTEHGFAYLASAVAIDNWMKRNATKEAVMLIAEDTSSTKAAVKMLHHGFTSVPPEVERSLEKRIARAHHIVDTVHFAQKDESPILQIADMCAFFIRRQLAKKRDSASLYEALKPHVILSSGRAPWGA